MNKYAILVTLEVSNIFKSNDIKELHSANILFISVINGVLKLGGIYILVKEEQP